MESPSALIQQIRFALDQLGDSNGHFTFERICFVFARRRISRNLLPPTGPVAAGGDQGRDGESFWSELPGTAETWTLQSNTESLVLACTTQKDGVATKIKEDLGKILSSGNPPDRVAYFTVASIPIASRHQLQDDARNNHGIELEVFDGVALSEHLSDADLFWAASEYLKIPASFEPSLTRSSSLPEWYVTDRDFVRSNSHDLSYTYGNFMTVRDLAHYSTFHKEARDDLAEFIPLLMKFAINGSELEIVQRARYEVAVATQRGEGVLTPQDATVIDFFSALRETPDDLPLMHDAVTLLTYAYGAWIRRNTNLALEQLENWYKELEEYVKQQIESATTRNRLASLKEVLVSLYLMADYSEFDASVSAGMSPEENLRELELQETLEQISVLPFAVKLRDGPAAIELVGEILDGLDKVPAFPIGSIASSIDLVSLSLASLPGFTSVRASLDEAVGRIEGAGAMAQRSLRRAEALLKSGQHVAAINEIHAAKALWWRGDTMSLSTQMMILASDVYQQLGMHLAGKQLALTAAVVAESSTPRQSALTAIALMTAAMCDYYAGQWLTATHLAIEGLFLHQEGAEHSFDLDYHADVASLLNVLHLVYRAVEDFSPDYSDVLRVLPGGDDNEVVEVDQDSEADDVDWWSVQGLVNQSESFGFGRPFSDAGATRRYMWTYQGRSWKVECAGDRPTVLATERWIAALQILQVDLFATSLVWAPGDVEISVELSSDEVGVEENEGGDASTRSWLVRVAEVEDDPAEHWASLAALLFEFTLRNCLTPVDRLKSIVDSAVAGGLLGKMSSGRPYDEAAAWLDIELYERLCELPTSPFLPLSQSVGNAFVSEISEAPPAPAEYDREAVLHTIAERYKTVASAIPYTLRRLSREPDFAAAMAQWRGKGWRDWQILSAIFNAVGNARLEQLGISPDDAMTDERVNELQEVFRRAETPDDPPPPAELMAPERFEMMLHMTVASCLASLGLEAHGHEEPNQLREFLNEYYGFAEDDTDHEHYF